MLSRVAAQSCVADRQAHQSQLAAVTLHGGTGHCSTGQVAKNGLAHRVPLSDLAMEVLVGLRERQTARMAASPYVLSAAARDPRRRRPTLARLGLSDFRGHDLRRTAASRMASAVAGTDGARDATHPGPAAGVARDGLSDSRRQLRRTASEERNDGGQTMERELQALTESPEFRRYHEKLHSRPFNPFDVLEVSELEIRHSNVLAWLLRSGGTHGIGGGFLRALVEHLTRRYSVRSLRRLTGFDDKDNVEVRREDYHEGWYADITVGFKTERVLLIIENKVVGWYPEAEQQARAYREALGKKYKNRYDHFPSVLLTASNSPKGGDAEHDMRDVASLSWDDVRGIIRSLLDDQENFADGHVRAFVERYLDVIEEKLISVGDDLAERLRNDHRRIYEKLREEPALLDNVDEPHRATIERWMEYFQPRWTELREVVARHLERRGGGRIRRTGGRGGWVGGWLYWWETPSVKNLGIDDCACWLFSFEPRKVTVELGTPLERDPKNPKLREIWRFLEDTPIDSGRPERYPMKMKHRVIYQHSLLNDAEHSGRFEESVELLHDSMDEFFGRDGDYERIERYLRCIAFDPQPPQQPAELEPRRT